ncbi:MAG TPA: hypothetical protein VKR06_34945 [Ktedonosporobacter sp.]|nr:hypothetical protein [Ktedonosporobacter sp.]
MRAAHRKTHRRSSHLAPILRKYRVLITPQQQEKPFPEPITDELLQRLNIPSAYHVRLLRLKTQEALWDCPGLDEDTILKIDQYMFDTRDNQAFQAITDQIWFPNGECKSEAYLGLAAYILAMRSLQGPIAGHSSEHSIVVSMRYTPRLLTHQQFQRAASLICACKMIRRSESRAWGHTPFRLGFWARRKSTPNTTEQSTQVINGSHDQFIQTGISSLRQLTHCPWCGSDIEVDRQSTAGPGTGQGRTLIYCGALFGKCPFTRVQARGEGLPMLVIDEEIYRFMPALLISTTDVRTQ